MCAVTCYVLHKVYQFDLEKIVARAIPTFIESFQEAIFIQCNVQLGFMVMVRSYYFYGRIKNFIDHFYGIIILLYGLRKTRKILY